MGISKQAYTEASRREELSAESLAPYKETLLKAAREKNQAVLNQIDAARLNTVMVEYLSRKVVKKLIDDGTLKHATSARLRNVDEELRNSFNPTTGTCLPDRMFREMTNDLWKNEAGDSFAQSTQVVKTFPGARADSHGRTFSMFVVDTPAVRRYVRYFNKVSSPYIGLSYLPVFFTKETFLARSICPSSNGGSRYGSGLGHIRERESLPDKILNFLTNRIFVEYHSQVLRYKTLRNVGTYYHQAHTMGLMINNARDCVINSILPVNVNRHRNTTQDAQPAQSFEREFRDLFRGTALAARPIDAEEGNLLIRVCNSISMELQRTLESMSYDIFTEMRKDPADMNNVPGFHDLLTWGTRKDNKFLYITLDFVISNNNRDKLGRYISPFATSAFSRLDNVPLNSAIESQVGVDLSKCMLNADRPSIPRGMVGHHDNIIAELGGRIGQEVNNAGSGMIGQAFYNSAILDDKIIERAARDSINAFNSMLRRNIWLSLL